MAANANRSAVGPPPFSLGGATPVVNPEFRRFLQPQIRAASRPDSPESATSPKTTHCFGSGSSASAEMSAAATARSAAGSRDAQAPGHG